VVISGGGMPGEQVEAVCGREGTAHAMLLDAAAIRHTVQRTVQFWPQPHRLAPPTLVHERAHKCGAGGAG